MTTICSNPTADHLLDESMAELRRVRRTLFRHNLRNEPRAYRDCFKSHSKLFSCFPLGMFLYTTNYK